MRKRAKMLCVLIGIVFLILLTIPIAWQRAGVLADDIDNLAYYLRNGRSRPKVSGCIMNLSEIQLAKQMWANEGGKSATDIAIWTDLFSYLGRQSIPICPEGGNYKVNAVGEWPTCSIGGSYHGSFHSSMPVSPSTNRARTNTVGLNGALPK